MSLRRRETLWEATSLAMMRGARAVGLACPDQSAALGRARSQPAAASPACQSVSWDVGSAEEIGRASVLPAGTVLSGTVGPILSHCVTHSLQPCLAQRGQLPLQHGQQSHRCHPLFHLRRRPHQGCSITRIALPSWPPFIRRRKKHDRSSGRRSAPPIDCDGTRPLFVRLLSGRD
jgi:hypothetical protein